MKPFLSDKIRKRVSSLGLDLLLLLDFLVTNESLNGHDFCQQIYFHGRDIHSLHKHINPRMLPDFLGGTGSVSFNDTVAKFNEKLFKNNQYYKGENRINALLTMAKLWMSFESNYFRFD